MLQQLRLFLTAVQFFTRIPVPAWVGHSSQQLDKAARYLPAVGIVVGVLAAAVLALAASVLPVSLAIALSMAASVLATGAFHEDGLSDFADGMGGGHTREKVLAIMKDSHAGAYGVIAVVLTLLIKYESLLALADKRGLIVVAAAMVAGHAVSRLAAVSIMLSLQYVRTDASARAKPAAQGLGRVSIAIASASALVALCIVLAAGAAANATLAGIGCVLLVRVYLAWRLQVRLGGYTGDCLGAVQQVTEIAFYVGLVAAR